MIGFLLVLIAIILYSTKYKRWSLLIYLFFISGFFGLIPTERLLGMKPKDLAFIYTIVICIHSEYNESFRLKEDKNIKKYISILFIFLLFSVVFSLFHYGFTFYQVLQGGRDLFIFLGYFFLRKTKAEDVIWLFKWMYYLTLFTSVLYILEVATGLPFLLSALDEDFSVDLATGINRFYNSPIYIALFVYTSVLCPEIIKRYKCYRVAPLIFCFAQLATLGRTEIGSVVIVLLVGFLLKNEVGRLVKYSLIGLICLIPFVDLLTSRFMDAGYSGDNTWGDLQSIRNGDYAHIAKYGKMTDSGTMTYRFAWIYERVEYLSHRPFLEKVFGLGMISDSQEILVQKMYNFRMGLINKNGFIVQMRTPDIAYGDIITQFGYVGGVIYMMLWFSLVFYLYKNRNISPHVFVFFLLAFGYLFRSFSGNTIAYTGTLCIFFLFMSLIPQLKLKAQNEINTCIIGCGAVKKKKEKKT